MGEDYHRPSEVYSEERTEPFSQSEYEARLKRSLAPEPIDMLDPSPVPLDLLRVEDHHHQSGIRILVRPLTRSRPVSPGSENCRWVTLRAEVVEDGPQHKVLAVTQTPKDIKFSVRIPGESHPPLWCEIYYDPASDNQILLNRSDEPITLATMSSRTVSEGTPARFTLNPGHAKALFPGTWRIHIQYTALLDFRILERQRAVLQSSPPPPPLLPQVSSSLGKRSLTPTADPDRTEKKRRTSDDLGSDRDPCSPGNDRPAGSPETDDGLIMFFRPSGADPLVFPLPNEPRSGELTVSNGQPLLEIANGHTAHIPGAYEIDGYYITKRDQIASTSLSSVFTAEHSSVPDDVVTVKVLKTRPPNPNPKPQESERNVIRQADMWLREYHSQDSLRHKSIVRLYGGDARYLSLFMEHVDARDLGSRGTWRNQANDFFLGSRADALRILRDVSGALRYLHGRNMVHNDIKPANILYSVERGAVLCDFGLSTAAKSPPTTGGTPYYVPPEFIGTKLRGPPSDVWALGITMLYVLGKIPFPDARARRVHPQPLYWIIADLNRPQPSPYPASAGAGRAQPASAVSQMQTWLGEISEVTGTLNRRDQLERLVAEMLTPNPHQRTTMVRITQELYVNEDVATTARISE